MFSNRKTEKPAKRKRIEPERKLQEITKTPTFGDDQFFFLHQLIYKYLWCLKKAIMKKKRHINTRRLPHPTCGYLQSRLHRHNWRISESLCLLCRVTPATCFRWLSLLRKIPARQHITRIATATIDWSFRRKKHRLECLITIHRVIFTSSDVQIQRFYESVAFCFRNKWIRCGGLIFCEHGSKNKENPRRATMESSRGDYQTHQQWTLRWKRRNPVIHASASPVNSFCESFSQQAPKLGLPARKGFSWKRGCLWSHGNKQARQIASTIQTLFTVLDTRQEHRLIYAQTSLTFSQTRDS